MKAKLLRNEEAAPGTVDDRIQMIHLEGKLRRCWPAGTIIDNPNACDLVAWGVAVPADTECENALRDRGVTPATIAVAQGEQDCKREELNEAIDINRSNADEQ